MNIKHALQTRPVLSSLAITILATLVWCLMVSPSWAAIPEAVAVAVLAGLFCFYPFVLTALNLFFCFLKHPGIYHRQPDLLPVSAAPQLGLSLHPAHTGKDHGVEDPGRDRKTDL
mgnify:FL=1